MPCRAHYGVDLPAVRKFLDNTEELHIPIKKSVADPKFMDVLLVPQHHGPVTINFGPGDPETVCRQQHIKINVLPKLSSKETSKYFTCSGIEHRASSQDSSVRLNFLVTIHNPRNSIRERGGDQFLTVELNGKQQGNNKGEQVNMEGKVSYIGLGKYNVTAIVYDNIASPGLNLVLSYLGERIVSESCKTIEKRVMKLSQTLMSTNRANANRVSVTLKECPLLSASQSVLGGRWIGDQWVLNNCKWRSFTKEMATDCLKTKNILFAGDSHLREQFVSLTSFMSQPRSIFKNTKFQADRQYKVGSSTFSFWWTNSAFFAPPDKKKSDFKADIIYASLYLADFGSFYLGVSEFVYAVDASVKALLQRYPNVRLIWQLPHAIHPHKTHKDWFIMNGFIQQKQFRQHMYAKLVQIPEYGHRFFLFDPWDMTSTRYGSSSDGNHYFQNGKQFGGPVVFSKVQIVLNLMCRPTTNITREN
eukprot:g15221.t1